ncbi:hypothetical protein KRX51_00805 [Corynebacterium sp. TAE3-ERU12]|nr:hypothetical protein [Corynebacterium sp. TAE3-ERU12]
MSGTTFTIARVQGVDLATAEGWERAKSMTVAEAQEAELAEPHSATTDDGGRATFNSLERGLYLVTAEPPNNTEYRYMTFEPFLVTVPVGAGDAWTCDPVLLVKPDGHTDDPKPGPGDDPTPGPGDDPDNDPGDSPGDGSDDTPGDGSDDGSSDSDDDGDNGSSGGGGGGDLPVTGAAVMGIAGAAVVLLGAGLLFLRLGKRGDRRG